MDRFTDVLRQAGLRVTRPRLAVLAVLEEQPHATADEVARAVRGRAGALSVQGTYDVLTALVAGGLAQRFQPAGSPARYETRTGDNHHHVVCRRCGHVADVDCAVGEAPCLEPSTTGGFDVDQAEVVWWGLCPRCQAEQASADAPNTQPRTMEEYA